jgi:hypothetical protein
VTESERTALAHLLISPAGSPEPYRRLHEDVTLPEPPPGATDFHADHAGSLWCRDLDGLCWIQPDPQSGSPWYRQRVPDGHGGWASVPLHVQDQAAPVGYAPAGDYLAYAVFLQGQIARVSGLTLNTVPGTYDAAANMVDEPDYGIWMITTPAPSRAGVSWTIGPSCVGRLIGALALDMITSFRNLSQAMLGILSDLWEYL